MVFVVTMPTMYFRFADVRMRAANSTFDNIADERGEFQIPLLPLFRRHLPYQLDQHLPCFRRRVARPHAYIIAAGGAGSLGSPALASGPQIINSASPAI